MKRQYYKTDELLAAVLGMLAMLLLFGFLISWKLVGENTYDYEMILYLILGGFTLLYFIYSAVLYLIANHKPIVQYEFDFENEQVHHFYKILNFTFADIKLYAYDSKHRTLRLFHKGHISAFKIAADEDDDPWLLTVDEMNTICKYAKKTSTKQLNSYGGIAIIVATIIQIIYMYLTAKSEASWQAIVPFQIFIVTFLNIAWPTGVTYFNRSRLERHYETILSKNNNTSED